MVQISKRDWTLYSILLPAIAEYIDLFVLGKEETKREGADMEIKKNTFYIFQLMFNYTVFY